MYNKVAATAVALVSLASAQTFTSCNPTQKTCPNDPALGADIKSIDFRNGKDSFFNVADGTTLTYDKDNGAVFSIGGEKEAPTITSSKYIFFGKVDVVIKASPGQGIVTSVTLQSDDLDEIDWEWLGGDSAQVQTNYFSKGCTDVYDRGGYSAVSNPQDGFHKYTIDWTKDSVKWLIDDKVVRTLSASSASGCDGFPQTPMQIKLGTWVAGRSDAPQGTVDWAGGLANFDGGKKYLGYYQSVTVQDYMGNGGATAAGEYSYGDKTGSYSSIKISGGNSSDTSSSSSSASSSASATKSATASSTGSVTTMTTATMSASNSTATTSPTKGSGSGSNSTAVQTSPAGGATASSVPKNAAGKVVGSLFLAGAGVVAAFLL